MRLKKIKLSGFKSFVDVVTVPVEKNLVGIVGPNGCGKSNVIDAVRWVMGESSAKQLRGDSMTDVIFNGTSTRKPVSQASIELVFDNTLSPLVGQYAKYTEIAIKRIMNRDGQSAYYLNNTKCRRKDLSDLFLGTGLGPRSYSIIEQGMISRVIEARPEDLRVYLEEAAGISKYKERRRETEVRIKHTKENLDRVNDIRTELGNQLEKLVKQAGIAEQYKVLKQDLNNQEMYHLGLQYQQLDTECTETTKAVQQKTIEIEQYNSLIESHNTEQEEKKIRVNQLQHETQEEQAKFYKIAQAISNIEQEIKQQEAEQAYTTKNLSNIERQISDCLQTLDAKNDELSQVSEDLTLLEPQHEELANSVVFKKDSLQEAEQNLASWEKEWHQQQELISDNGRAINQSQALIEKHETLIVRSQKRIESLREEQQCLKLESKKHNLLDLRHKQAAILQIEEDKQYQLEQIIENANNTEEAIINLQEELNQNNQLLQAKKGTLSSLQTLQEHALGKDQKVLNNWLQENNLSKSSRLGEIIQIEAGWEMALEAILRDYIKAIVLPNDKSIDSLNLFDQDLSKLNTAFLNNKSAEIPGNDNLNNNLKASSNKNMSLLIDKIKAPREISHLLNYIYCVDDIAAAKDHLPSLASYESIITKDGKWLNNNWYTAISVVKNNNQDSILSREADIKKLNNEITELKEVVSHFNQELIIKKSDLDEIKAQRNGLQLEIREIIKNSSDIKSEISREEYKAEQQSSRLFQIERELGEAINHVEIDSAAVKTNRAKLEKSVGAMEDLSGFKANLQARGDELKIALRDIRQAYDSIKDKVHTSDLSLQKLEQQKNHLINEVNRLEQQKIALTNEQTELNIKIQTFDEPLLNLKYELEEQLINKHQQGEKLSQKNQILEESNQALNIIDKKIIELRKAHDAVRDKLEEFKIKQHELTARLTAVKERIQEQNLEIEHILKILPDNLNINEVRNKVRNLKQQIEDLGPVNLTAIEEYNTESERKRYLDEQEADLQKALLALEDAISQIDQETKNRFKETFDFVNEQFQYLFPKVFGGGRASLILSGEDLLDTGVTVMAQPPGKRNSSIHLLSGGEKALTAIALVFSIFRLNPAPFCMLDEVDAPLDDANVARYCNLVKEMSKDVQFIFITHNKVAMTMAQHLLGVTMNEPGVSRLVAVDVDEAIQLAEI